MHAGRAERVLMLLDAARRGDRQWQADGATIRAQRDRGWYPSGNGTDAMAAALLRRWKSRAELQMALEDRARMALGNVVPAGELAVFIEQQVATEQTEYICEFFWLLRAVGCTQPRRMAVWIDRHNAMIDREPVSEGPIGPQRKRILWRLRTARFSEDCKAACAARQNGRRIVLSLKAMERFMALHMDATLCRDRLDALARIGLLEDETFSNLRLFRGTGDLDGMVTGALASLVCPQ